MTRHMLRGLMAALVAMLAIPLATPAAAQATRTWISGVGDDANPCSRTAPCRTFAGSISKTAAGGEINCLDQGSFGAVTITKSIKLLCDEVDATTIASGTNGINVAAGANDSVVISGLHIDGMGTGLNGVRFISGGSLVLRNMTIRGFGTANSYAVNFASTTPASSLTISNVALIKNGVGNGSGGVLVQGASNSSVKVAIDDLQVSEGAGGAAIRFDATGVSNAVITGTVSNSNFSHAGNAVIAKAPSGNSVNILVSDNVISTNQNGIVAQDVGSTVYVSGNAVSQNTAFGVRSLSGGNVVSLGDNDLANNSNNGAFTATVGKQ